MVQQSIHNTENYHQNASNQDITASQLGRKESDRKSILEEDIYNDEDVTITLEEGDDEYKTMRSVKSSSNQWEDSYYKRENDGSKEYRQIKMQKISTSRVLSKQPGTRQPADKDSNLKEGSQVNNSTVVEKVKNEVTEATGYNTVRLGETRAHIQNEVGTTHINGKKVVPMFESCSSATVINHSIIAESDEVEIRIRNIEGHSYKCHGETPWTQILIA